MTKKINKYLVTQITALLTILLLSFVFYSVPVAAQNIENINGSVVSVADGDTIKIRQNNNQITTIRLACIDAPEMSQIPWGEESQVRLKQFLPIGKKITLKPVDTDKYNRLVAEIFSDNRNINVDMVKEGKAVVYQKYLSNCSDSQTSLLQAQNTAKENGLGLWNQQVPEMPWDFRRGKKSNNKSINTTCDPAYPNVCIPQYPPDLNCPDIPYRKFKVLSSDPHGFDRDGNGLGCES